MVKVDLRAALNQAAAPSRGLREALPASGASFIVLQSIDPTPGLCYTQGRSDSGGCLSHEDSERLRARHGWLQGIGVHAGSDRAGHWLIWPGGAKVAPQCTHLHQSQATEAQEACPQRAGTVLGTGGILGHP
jgi:hypothetical protein